jgi:hypothetical protein
LGEDKPALPVGGEHNRVTRVAEINESAVGGRLGDGCCDRNGVRGRRRKHHGDCGREIIPLGTVSTSQVVTSSGVIPLDNTTPANSEANTVLSLSVTPTFSNSLLRVCYSGTVGISGGGLLVLAFVNEGVRARRWSVPVRRCRRVASR